MTLLLGTLQKLSHAKSLPARSSIVRQVRQSKLAFWPLRSGTGRLKAEKERVVAGGLKPR